MRFVWQIIAVVAISFAGGRALMAVQNDPWPTLAVGAVTVAVALPLYGWVVRKTEKRPSIEVGRVGLVGGIGWGTLLGGGLFALVIVNIAFLEGYEVDGLGTPVGAVGLFGFMAGAAVTEELLYRGVLFRIVEERLGTWLSLLLTGLVFGLGHLLNPNANLWGAIAIAIEAGGMLAAAYVATRKLWLPIGLHFGWNFAASGVFSTEVSGNGTPQGLLDSTMSGPVLLTGGDFGPEGSLYSVAFCVITALVLLWVAKRRDRLVPLRGSRNKAKALADPTATLAA